MPLKKVLQKKVRLVKRSAKHPVVQVVSSSHDDNAPSIRKF